MRYVLATDDQRDLFGVEPAEAQYEATRSRSLKSIVLSAHLTLVEMLDSFVLVRAITRR